MHLRIVYSLLADKLVQELLLHWIYQKAESIKQIQLKSNNILLKILNPRF